MNDPINSVGLDSNNVWLQRSATTLLWIGATGISVFLAMLVIDSAFFEGEYIPMGNDSFYHARRMLDTAIGERGFYQFDERIHVPDGSWIPWPWAYDYLMGQSARFVVWLSPTTDPLGFLAYVPVIWLAINAALFLAAARQAGLTLMFCAIAMLAFALSPFVQLMHMPGKVDHHFIEFSFVLLVTWLGLRWFSAPQSRASAIGLGLALGLAPGFHNGMFILQIPVLLAVGLHWLRGERLARRDLNALASTLLATTVLVVLPSEPFRQGLFEFGLLSWFHLYAAASTSIVLVFIGWRSYDKRSLLTLTVLCALLAIPLLGQLTHGAAFLSRDISILKDVIEAMSPFTLFFDKFGPLKTVAQYSWLLVLAPPLLVYFLFCLLRRCSRRDLFFAVMTVFGLAFLLMQFRFNYFGLFSLIVGSLIAAQRLSERFQWQRGPVFVSLLASLLIAYQPPLRQHLFAVYALGAAPLYERARPLFLELAKRCEQQPGVILAHENDGNYLLFHTQCSVISNNFMLTQNDERKIAQIGAMMRLSPDALREYQPDVKYLLLRVQDFIVEHDGKIEIDSNAPLGSALLSNSEPPEGFELIRTIWLEQNGQQVIYAKAFEVH
jgi:asparagine N-glycosylation enzyme membrane subunit Stt3